MKMEKGEVKTPKKLIVATWNDPTNFGFETTEKRFFNNKYDAVRFVRKNWIKELNEAEEETFVEVKRISDDHVFEFWKVEEDMETDGKIRAVQHFGLDLSKKKLNKVI